MGIFNFFKKKEKKVKTKQPISVETQDSDSFLIFSGQRPTIVDFPRSNQRMIRIATSKDNVIPTILKNNYTIDTEKNSVDDKEEITTEK